MCWEIAGCHIFEEPYQKIISVVTIRLLLISWCITHKAVIYMILNNSLRAIGGAAIHIICVLII